MEEPKPIVESLYLVGSDQNLFCGAFRYGRARRLTTEAAPFGLRPGQFHAVVTPVPALLGLGRIVTLHRCSITLYQIR